jgi:tellurite resistance protein TehA-like permease
MEIEQLPPKQPNFLRVVILFGVSLILIFILAMIFVRFDGNHLTFRHHSSHPTSQLVLPHIRTPSTSARLV